MTDWVTRYSECTAKGVLAAIQKRVEKDIELIDGLHTDFVRRKVVLEPGGSSSFMIVREGRMAAGDAVTEVYAMEASIEVHHVFLREKFTVHINWNCGIGKCEMFIDQEPQKLWQISQRILTETIILPR